MGFVGLDAAVVFLVLDRTNTTKLRVSVRQHPGTYMLQWPQHSNLSKSWVHCAEVSVACETGLLS